MSDAAKPPPAALMVTQHVDDYDAWKGVFDANRDARKAASVLGHHLNQAEGDPNAVTVWLPVADVEAAKAFESSHDLKTARQRGGVKSVPQAVWMEPLRMAIVTDRRVPAIIVSHSVADVDAWLAGYDGAAELRTANGITGHAANRSLDDPSMIYVYHQAESLDTLRTFLGNPDLKAGMEAAGVTSAPEVAFVTGGPLVTY